MLQQVDSRVPVRRTLWSQLPLFECSYHLVNAWPLAGFVTSLCLSIFIRKTEYVMLGFTDLFSKSTHVLLSRAQWTFLLRLCNLTGLCLNPLSDSVCSYVVTSPFLTQLLLPHLQNVCVCVCVKANIHGSAGPSLHKILEDSRYSLYFLCL